MATSGDDAHLREVGLYGENDSLVAKKVALKDSAGKFVYNAVNQKGDSVYYGSFKKDDFSAFKKGQFRFKAESDWYKVGVTMDRWDRVDGFIEKYSFVVDDPCACAVYMRHVGGEKLTATQNSKGRFVLHDFRCLA